MLLVGGNVPHPRGTEVSKVTSNPRSDESTGRTKHPGGRRRLAGALATAMSLSLAVGVAAVGVAGFGAGASASSAAQTLHLFSQEVTNTWTTASGQSIPGGPSQANPPKPGDTLQETDLDYVGTHTEHAKHWTVSDHLSCLVNSKEEPICQAEIAIGGSMLLATGVPTGAAKATFDIVGGTGAYAGVGGTVATDNYSPKSEDSDITITLHR
jgi:hypothetical protein